MMPAGDSDTLEHRLVTQTTTYLDQVGECIECLPPLVEQYAADEHYQSTSDQISTVESRCDRTNREISSLVADADVRDLGIRLTRVHLHSRQTIELFHLVDDVANAAEQFADELVATAPERRPEELDLLRQMAATAVDAMDSFRRLITAFVKVVSARRSARPWSQTRSRRFGRPRATATTCATNSFVLHSRARECARHSSTGNSRSN